MLYEIRYLDRYDQWVRATVRAVSPKQAVFLLGLRLKKGYLNRLYGTEMCQVHVVEEEPLQLSLDF